MRRARIRLPASARELGFREPSLQERALRAPTPCRPEQRGSNAEAISSLRAGAAARPLAGSAPTSSLARGAGLPPLDGQRTRQLGLGGLLARDAPRSHAPSLRDSATPERRRSAPRRAAARGARGDRSRTRARVGSGGHPPT